jgi:hypothetical protein
VEQMFNGDFNLEGWVSTPSSWVATLLSSGTKKQTYIAYVFRDKITKSTGCCYFKFINIFPLLNITLRLFQNKRIQVLFRATVSILEGAFLKKSYKNARMPVCLYVINRKVAEGIFIEFDTEQLHLKNLCIPILIKVVEKFRKFCLKICKKLEC